MNDVPINMKIKQIVVLNVILATTITAVQTICDIQSTPSYCSVQQKQPFYMWHSKKIMINNSTNTIVIGMEY